MVRFPLIEQLIFFVYLTMLIGFLLVVRVMVWLLETNKQTYKQTKTQTSKVAPGERENRLEGRQGKN